MIFEVDKNVEIRRAQQSSVFLVAPSVIKIPNQVILENSLLQAMPRRENFGMHLQKEEETTIKTESRHGSWGAEEISALGFSLKLGKKLGKPHKPSETFWKPWNLTLKPLTFFCLESQQIHPLAARSFPGTAGKRDGLTLRFHPAWGWKKSPWENQFHWAQSK